MKRILAVAIVAVLAVPLLAFGQTTQCSSDYCGPSDPPHSPDSRGYSDFITLAYQGAYGRPANCIELRNEYSKLVNAANGGTLNAEAQRFVATLFMTQTSYNDSNLDDYVQTSAYNAIRPMSPNDRTVLTAFVGDLYRAFLQREPDAGGQCFWTNDACGNTTAEASRKHPIRAFQASSEFADLVNGLYDDGLPDACIICPRGEICQ
jgi:hypothetical protein